MDKVEPFSEDRPEIVVQNIFEHHRFIPEHFLKTDCEVRLLAAKNYAACVTCVTFRLVYVRVVQSSGEQTCWFH